MLSLHGEFVLSCWEGRRLQWWALLPNAILSAALNGLLSSYFLGTSPPAPWYLGLIDATGFLQLADSDTPGSHAGWNEFLGYTLGTRPAWGPTVSGGVASNGTGTPLTASVSGYVQGLFLATSNTKGGTAGSFWSTAAYSLARPVFAGQVLRVQYSLRAGGT